MEFYKKYCDLKVRVAPYRKCVDFETIKTVAAIDALADRADTVHSGANPNGRFGWGAVLGMTEENFFKLALDLLARLETGAEPLRGKFAEPGGALIDHSFIEAEGEMHLFYNRGYIGYDWPERFVDSIGHAVSRDLISWEIKPPVLTAEKGGPDDHQVWSPGVIRYKDGYRMFYTGVNFNIAQAACMAKSNDLYNWTRYEKNPLFLPGSWCPWSYDKWSDCRDGMTFADDDGMFYMYYCSSRICDDGTVKSAMGMASTKDLSEWKDEGFFPLESCSSAPESPFVIKRNGTYTMFYTNCEKGGTSYATSSHPLKGWTDRELIIPGPSCSEVFEFKDKWYISQTTHCGGGMHFLEISEFFWNNDGTVRVGPVIK